MKKMWTGHDDVIKWKHFPRYWPFVRGIHRWPVNSRHKGQWCGALMFSLICIWKNSWISNHEAGDLRRYRAHYDVIVMKLPRQTTFLIPLHCQACYIIFNMHNAGPNMADPSGNPVKQLWSWPLLGHLHKDIIEHGARLLIYSEINMISWLTWHLWCLWQWIYQGLGAN